jgi:CheY-like chemotaxis protein
MPGIDGLELQRRLAPTGVPIIFMTGHDDPAVRKMAFARGATRTPIKRFAQLRLNVRFKA